MTLIKTAGSKCINNEKELISLNDILASFFELNESFSVYILNKNGVTKTSLLKYISHGISVKSAKKALNTSESVRTKKEEEYLSKFSSELTEKALSGSCRRPRSRKNINCRGNSSKNSLWRSS